jgi:enamine deaminase RidA (YjgF/YER057c/UK114 family)
MQPALFGEENPLTGIARVRGVYSGRNAGTKYNGFAWAVGTDTGADGGRAPDVHAQTLAALAEIDRVLGELGTDRTRLLSATVYLPRIALKAEMDRAWCAWIGDDPRHWPQRACVEAGLAGETLVEITVLAACP